MREGMCQHGRRMKLRHTAASLDVAVMLTDIKKSRSHKQLQVVNCLTQQVCLLLVVHNDDTTCSRPM